MKKRVWKFLLIIAITAFSFVSFYTIELYAAQVSLTWEANSEPYLGGYKIHYGVKSRGYTSTVDVGNQTNYAIDLEPGLPYYASVTAYDETGVYESDFSNEVIIDIPLHTTYEDAEDGGTEKWTISDSYPSGASISNVFDEECNSRVIQFTGDSLENSYSLTTDEGDAWHNTAQSIIEWSMRYEETFIIYIIVNTTVGARILYYSPYDSDLLGQLEYIHHGLGSWAKDGRWHTFVRDLQADIKDAQPGVEIIEVNGFIISGSGRIDDIMLRNQLTDDPDGDLISAEDEITIYETNPNADDSDGDGISDGIELSYWGDRFVIDYDSDELNNLLDNDSDNDGFSDSIEIASGSDPADDLSNPTQKTVYEDAEDGSTARWHISDNDPAWASISNVFDFNRQSRVIQLSGAGLDNSYTLTNAEGSKWKNSTQFVIEWSMRYTEPFAIYLIVKTTRGFWSLIYTPDDYNSLGDKKVVHHGLGSLVIDGRWHTFVRDLQADLQEAEPGMEISEVNEFVVYGSGLIDDVKLREK